jgi:hypothetical protein
LYDARKKEIARAPADGQGATVPELGVLSWSNWVRQKPLAGLLQRPFKADREHHLESVVPLSPNPAEDTTRVGEATSFSNSILGGISDSCSSGVRNLSDLTESDGQ